MSSILTKSFEVGTCKCITLVSKSKPISTYWTYYSISIILLRKFKLNAEPLLRYTFMKYNIEKYICIYFEIFRIYFVDYEYILESYVQRWQVIATTIYGPLGLLLNFLLLFIIKFCKYDELKNYKVYVTYFGPNYRNI
jgi:hypothetical protein